MGLNPLNLTSGHKFEPVQGFKLIIDWSCLTFQKIMLGFWPRIILKFNFEPEQGLKFRGDFFSS